MNQAAALALKAALTAEALEAGATLSYLAVEAHNEDTWAVLEQGQDEETGEERSVSLWVSPSLSFPL